MTHLYLNFTFNFKDNFFRYSDEIQITSEQVV